MTSIGQSDGVQYLNDVEQLDKSSLRMNEDSSDGLYSAETAASSQTAFEIEHKDAEVQLIFDPNDEKTRHRNIKTAKDGTTILIPQPSDDPHDPLNWSKYKKLMILITLGMGGFCADFSSGVGIPAFVYTAETYGVSVQDAVNVQNINTLMIGLGGVFWIPFIYFWGRAPTFFWTLLVGTIFSLLCAVAPTFTSFYAFRACQTFFLTAGQTMGLACVREIYFYHEHARKIGLYICIFYASPYLGPMFSGFMIDGLGGEWRAPFWLAFAINIITLIMACVFIEETMYDRENPPVRNTNLIRRRFTDLMGLGYRTEKRMPVGKAFMRLAIVISKPIVFPLMVWFSLTFMWAIGINVTSSILIATPPPAGYGYSLTGTSFVYFTPVVALIIGELIGHWANDWIQYYFARKHHGNFVPEVRLYSTWPALVLCVVGLTIVGQTLQYHYNVVGIIIPWGMYVVGVIIQAVAGTSYVLASYPNAAGELQGYIPELNLSILLNLGLDT